MSNTSRRWTKAAMIAGVTTLIVAASAAVGVVSSAAADPPAPIAADTKDVPPDEITHLGPTSADDLVDFTLSLVDRNGRAVARKEASIAESFLPVAEGERACTTALTASFNAGAYEVVGALDTW